MRVSPTDNPSFFPSFSHICRTVRTEQRRLEFLEDYGTKVETLQQMYDEHQSLGAPSGKKRGPSEDSADAVEAKKAKSNTPTPTAASAGFPTSVAAPHPGMDPTQAAAAAAAWSQQQQQQQQQQQPPQPQQQPPWAGQQWAQGQGQWGQQGYGYGNYGSYGNYAYPQQ